MSAKHSNTAYTSAAFSEHLEYWKDKIKIASASESYPFQRSRNVPSSGQKLIISAQLDTETANTVRALVGNDPIGVFTVMLTGLGIVLSRTSQLTSFVVKTPFLKSSAMDGDTYLINGLQQDESLKNTLIHFRSTITRAYQFQDYPLHLAGGDFIDTTNLITVFSPDIHVSRDYHQTDVVIKIGIQSDITIEFACAPYIEQSQVEMLAQSLKFVMSSFHSLDKPICEIPLLSKLREEEIFQFSRGERVELQPGGSVINTFYSIAEQFPDQAAVISEGDTITYQKLNERSNQLARHLLENYQVRAGQAVGVFLDRSIWLIIAQVAIQKIGAVYVPLSIDYPDDRIRYMIEKADVDVILANSGEMMRLVPMEKQVFIMDLELYSLNSSSDDLFFRPAANDTSYIIFTSGTSNVPKAIPVRHESLLNLSQWHASTFQVNEHSRATMYSSVGFDASIWELWPYLISAATLVVLTKEERINMQKLVGVFKAEQITHTFLPTVICQELVKTVKAPEFARQLTIFTGGEALRIETLNGWTVVNNYGLTETAVVATWFPVPPNFSAESVPVGRPLFNTDVFILDDNLKLLPPYAVGSLYIGGISVSHSYVKDDALSAKRFIINPYNPSQLLYSTGDTGFWRKDGNIQFSGRRDDQVKIRGHRIELAEIEQALVELSSVTKSCVLALEFNGELQLVAFIVTSDVQNEKSISSHLSKKLPAFMLPSRYVFLDDLPITANDKVDRKSLAQYEFVKSEADFDLQDATAAESKLIVIWKEILGRSDIRPTTDFFESGGNSLLATRLMSRVYRDMGINLGLREIFSFPTVRGLAAILEKMNPETPALIEPLPKSSHYALSNSQQRLWILCQVEDASIAYNVTVSAKISGELDNNLLLQSFQLLIERHEILRTIFIEADGEPRQVILDKMIFRVDFQDLRRETGPSALASERINEQIRKPFDLRQGPLLRVSVIQVADKEYLFALIAHHIICDGLSIETLYKEVLSAYSAQIRGVDFSRAPLRIQYKEYAAWQQSEVAKEEMAKHRTYWSGSLEGIQPLTFGGKPRPRFKTYNGRRVPFYLGQQSSIRLRSLAQSQGTTLFMNLLSLVNIFLSKITGQRDIVIGTPQNTRSMVELEDQIGFYLNMLPLRNKLDTKDSFEDVLRMVRKNTLAAFEHAAYPFEQIVEDVTQKRDLTRSPIFDVMISVHAGLPTGEGWQELPMNFESHSHDHSVSMYDMIFNFIDQEDEIKGTIIYNPDVLEETYASRLGELLSRLCGSLVDSPKQEWIKSSLLSERERTATAGALTAILDEVRQKNILELFSLQVAQLGNEIAILFNEQSINYRLLDQLSSSLSEILIEDGIKQGEVVALLMERSPLAIISMIAVMKAGAIYMPLDASHPTKRIQYMINDSGASLVLHTERHSGLAKECHANCLRIDEAMISNRGLDKQKHYYACHEIMYLLYTSGSTGNPKGVEVRNLSVVNNLLSLASSEHLSFGTEDRFAATTTFSFDISVLEIFLPLISGGSLVLFTEEDLESGSSFSYRVERSRPTFLQATPTRWRMIMETWDAKQNLNVLCGGERLDAALARTLLSNFKNVWNVYGPTEATIWTSIKKITNEFDITIGKALANNLIRILDEQHLPVPDGIPGEIGISGIGLAKGYRFNDRLTAERFVADPIVPHMKIYLTGDYGRVLANGEIEFTGREDSQVKIRGHRVELNEIEATLKLCPGVKDAVAIFWTTPDLDGTLAAYLISEPDLSMQIRAWVKDQLPTHMMPDYFILMDRFPVTANGKIQRDRFQRPSESDRTTQGVMSPPQTDLEMLILSIWKEVLLKDAIGIDENFFEIGGQSIKAVRVSYLIQKHHGSRVDLKTIFECPTIRQLAGAIDKFRVALRPPIAATNPGSIHPSSPQQSTMWVMEHAKPGAYNMPQAFLLKGTLDVDSLQRAIDRLISEYEILRTVFDFRDDVLIQQIKSFEPRHFKIDVVDCSAVAQDNSALEKIVNEYMWTRFDLQDGPLLRVKVFGLAPDRFILVIVTHHIVNDAQSEKLLLQKIKTYYNWFVAGGVGQADSPKYQYKDFVYLQQQLIAELNNEAREFWQKEFQGSLLTQVLMKDKVALPGSAAVGKRLEFSIEEKQLVNIKTMSQQFGVTPFTVYLSLTQLFVHTFFQIEDFAIGTPVTVRPGIEFEDQLGLFINTVPIRLKQSQNNALSEYLTDLRNRLPSIYKYRFYPFEKLVNDLGIASRSDQNPLFDIWFVYLEEEKESEQVELRDLEVSNFLLGEDFRPRFDLQFSVVKSQAKTRVIVEYNAQVYEQTTITQMKSYFLDLINKAIESPFKSCDALPAQVSGSELETSFSFKIDL